MFWGLFFPLALGTLFYMAFGGLKNAENFSPIKTAVVSSGSNAMFDQTIRQLDGQLIEVNYVDEEEALRELKEGEVSGIFYSGENPSLSVAGNGYEPTILSEILREYNEYTSIAVDMMKTHPERIAGFFKYLQSDETEYIQNVSLGGRSYDEFMEYFFALIAMACSFGCYTGQMLGEQSAANISTLAARRAISPQKKSSAIFTDMLVGFVIQSVSVTVLLLYLNYVLHVKILAHPAQMFLIVAMGSLLGVSYGIFIGTLNVKEGVKVVLTTAVPLFLCFLSGLMYGNMKQVIEENAPMINRLNPMALISDALYYLNVYESRSEFMLRVVILAVYSFGMAVIAFVKLRRERYASI